MKKLSKKQFSYITLAGAIIIGIMAGVLGYINYKFRYGDGSVDSFVECAKAGNPIMESFPEQCSANGRTFVNVIDSYESCIYAGNPSLNSNPPACEANGQLYREGED